MNTKYRDEHTNKARQSFYDNCGLNTQSTDEQTWHSPVIKGSSGGMIGYATITIHVQRCTVYASTHASHVREARVITIHVQRCTVYASTHASHVREARVQ